MWGGRFAAGPAAIMEEINVSIDFDKRLAAQDLAGSRAHAQMLVAKGILSQEDGTAIARGLDQVAAEIEAGRVTFRRELEDIHLNVESRPAELIGPAAGRSTPAGPATTRWRPISASGCGRPATTPANA